MQKDNGTQSNKLPENFVLQAISSRIALELVLQNRAE